MDAFMFNDLRLEVSKPPFHTLEIRIGLVWFMVFNSTFNNISAILWRSVLLVEERGVPGENH
jgi:tryptophan-rich sensory protein